MNVPDEPFKQKLVPVNAQAIQKPKSKSHCNVPHLAWAYWPVGQFRVKHESDSSSQVVILQRWLVIVGDGQRVSSLDQEVIVHTTMLVVMHCCRPVGWQELYFAQGFTLHNAAMAQQHVGHLYHWCHMYAADITPHIGICT